MTEKFIHNKMCGKNWFYQKDCFVKKNDLFRYLDEFTLKPTFKTKKITLRRTYKAFHFESFKAAFLFHYEEIRDGIFFDQKG